MYIPEFVYKHNHSSITHTVTLKPKMSININQDYYEKIILYSYNAILYSTENKLATAIYISIEEYQKHNIEQTKQVW